MLVIVVAKSQEEFREMVLKDSPTLGDGSLSFLREEAKEATFRSSKDEGFTVKYVWATSREEVRASLTQDNFRIIGGSQYLKPEKSETSHSIFFGVLIAAAIGSVLVMMFA